MRRLSTALALLLAAALLAGCSDPDPADQIESLFDGLTEASAEGVESMYSYIAEHDHPAMPCTVDLLRGHYRFPADLAISFTVVPETIEPDPGWAVLSGPHAGEVPEGDIYYFDVIQTVAEEPSSTDSHAAVLDGDAYFFISCFEDEGDE